MPAFTFEKLSAPAEHGPAAPPAEKQRGTLGQLLHRLSEARVRRSLREHRSPPESESSTPSK
jgi:hypothetical protein